MKITEGRTLSFEDPETATFSLSQFPAAPNLRAFPDGDRIYELNEEDGSGAARAVRLRDQ